MDPEIFAARLRLDEHLPEDVEAFLAWALPRRPDGYRLTQLAAQRPITTNLDRDYLTIAVHEAGLRLPNAFDAVLTLARHEMRRLVAGEIEPEECAGNIELLSENLTHPVVSELPQLWNFCVYRRYLRGAADVGETGWYNQVVDDIRAEAEYHLGLRENPPEA